MKQGIHRISKEQYIKDPCPEPSLSRSTIYDLLFNSPAHARYNHPRLNPDYEIETADKFDIGTACHSMLLEGIDNIHCIDANDWRKKENKEERDQLRAEGKTVLLRNQYEKTKLMVESAKNQIAESELGIKDLATEGESELTYIWTETVPITKNLCWLRARLDWIRNDKKLVIDYKTTSASANPNNYASIITNNGLDIQCAIHKKAVKSLENSDAQYVLIVQETYKPYLCSFLSLPPEFEQMGNDKVNYGIILWNQCMQSEIWEGYPKRIAYVEPPSWALAQFEIIAERIEI
jgi:hypothetical protein